MGVLSRCRRERVRARTTQGLALLVRREERRGFCLEPAGGGSVVTADAIKATSASMITG